MEERFDTLEQMIGSLATRFDSVDERFNAVDQRFNEVGQRFNEVGERFDEVDSGLAGVRQGLTDVNQRVGVLHEDVTSDIRFTLEARQALQEVMETKFAEQERSFSAALAPIADAVRSSHRQ